MEWRPAKCEQKYLGREKYPGARGCNTYSLAVLLFGHRRLFLFKRAKEHVGESH